MSALAKDVSEVAGRLPHGPVHLVGHSFGGFVARAAVLTTLSSFQSLTLMSSGPGALPGGRGVLVRLLAECLEVGDRAGAWQIALRLADLPDAGDDGGGAAFVQHRFERTSSAALVTMANVLLEEPDRVQDLRSVAVPMLVLYGAEDDGWPVPLQVEMAERLGARQVAIAQAAHSPATEQPRSTAAALLGFWAEVEGRSESA